MTVSEIIELPKGSYKMLNKITGQKLILDKSKSDFHLVGFIYEDNNIEFKPKMILSLRDSELYIGGSLSIGISVSSRLHEYQLGLFEITETLQEVAC